MGGGGGWSKVGREDGGEGDGLKVGLFLLE